MHRQLCPQLSPGDSWCHTAAYSQNMGITYHEQRGTRALGIYHSEVKVLREVMAGGGVPMGIGAGLKKGPPTIWGH